MIPRKRDGPMSTCRIRWPVTLTDEPVFVMFGSTETVTAVAFGEHIRRGVARERQWMRHWHPD